MARIEISNSPTVNNEASFREFLEWLDSHFSEIGYTRTQLEYAQRMGGAYDPTLREELERAADRLYTERNHNTIQDWSERVEDPWLRRWAQVLDRDFTVERLEQQPELRAIVREVADRYREWRPSLDGQPMSYTQQTWILRHETDRDKRRRAWMALWPLGEELETITRDMFSLRNELARAHGFATYGDMKLAFDEVDRAWLLGLIDQMEETTADTYRGYLQEQADRYGIVDVQPWDVQFLYDGDPWPDPVHFPADKLPDNVFACARALGQDTENMGIRIFWYDSPYGGQCMTYAPGDLRILTNKGDGMLYYHTAYHEYGHAIHGWYYDVPYSLRQESSMFTEGMAQFMALFLHYPSWLRRTGLSEETITSYRETRKLPWMYRHRRIVADVAAEFAVWDDPTHDFNQTYGETTSRYLLCGVQPRPFAATPRWTWPMRMHSYFIADLISAQTHAYLRREFAPVFGSGQALEHVRQHYWAPGNSIPWLEKVERCTGEPLTYRYLGAEMTQPVPDS